MQAASYEHSWELTWVGRRKKVKCKETPCLSHMLREEDLAGWSEREGAADNEENLLSVRQLDHVKQPVIIRTIHCLDPYNDTVIVNFEERRAAIQL